MLKTTANKITVLRIVLIPVWLVLAYRGLAVPALIVYVAACLSDMLDGYMVWYRDKRIRTEFGHGHHGPSTRARSCGMIGGDGINDESNKMSPAPSGWWVSDW